MAWSLEVSRTVRWTVRPIAYLVMQVARLGIWLSERLIRGSLWLGADPKPLERLPPHERERLMNGGK